MKKSNKPKTANTGKLKKQVLLKDLPAAERTAQKVKGGGVGPCEGPRR